MATYNNQQSQDPWELMGASAHLTSSVEDSPTYGLQLYSLNKNIMSNKYANELYAKAFGKLAKSSEPVDQQKVLDIYNEVYWDMPEEGDNSHADIVEQSYNFINWNHFISHCKRTSASTNLT
mgnify:CR=1 FL=1